MFTLDVDDEEGETVLPFTSFRLHIALSDVMLCSWLHARTHNITSEACRRSLLYLVHISTVLNFSTCIHMCISLIVFVNQPGLSKLALGAGAGLG